MGRDNGDRKEEVPTKVRYAGLEDLKNPPNIPSAAKLWGKIYWYGKIFGICVEIIIIIIIIIIIEKMLLWLLCFSRRSQY